jgi:hypothetical protein
VLTVAKDLVTADLSVRFIFLANLTPAKPKWLGVRQLGIQTM